MNQLKKRWGITSNTQLFLIFLVFTINGTFAAWIAKPVTNFVGISSSQSPWIYYPVRIILIFIVYQITLPIVGFLFGQYNFFNNFSKKTLSRIGLGWLFKKS